MVKFDYVLKANIYHTIQIIIRRSLFFITYPVMHPTWLYYGIAFGTGATGLQVSTELVGLDPNVDAPDGA